MSSREMSLYLPSLSTFFFVNGECLPAGSNGAGALGTSSPSQGFP